MENLASPTQQLNALNHKQTKRKLNRIATGLMLLFTSLILVQGLFLS